MGPGMYQPRSYLSHRIKIADAISSSSWDSQTQRIWLPTWIRRQIGRCLCFSFYNFSTPRSLPVVVRWIHRPESANHQCLFYRWEPNSSSNNSIRIITVLLGCNSRIFRCYNTNNNLPSSIPTNLNGTDTCRIAPRIRHSDVIST